MLNVFLHFYSDSLTKYKLLILKMFNSLFNETFSACLLVTGLGGSGKIRVFLREDIIITEVPCLWNITHHL